MELVNLLLKTLCHYSIRFSYYSETQTKVFYFIKQQNSCKCLQTHGIKKCPSWNRHLTQCFLAQCILWANKPSGLFITDLKTKAEKNGIRKEELHRAQQPWPNREAVGKEWIGRQMVVDHLSPQTKIKGQPTKDLNGKN